MRYHQAQLQVEIQSIKSFLTTVIVHLSIDYLKSSRHQRERYVGVWLPEPVLTTDTESFPSEIMERREGGEDAEGSPAVIEVTDGYSCGHRDVLKQCMLAHFL